MFHVPDNCGVVPWISKSDVLVKGSGRPNWKSTPVWCSSVVTELKRVALMRRFGTSGVMLLYKPLRASSTVASAPITSAFFFRASFTASSTVDTWAPAFAAQSSRASTPIQARRIIRSHPPRSAVSVLPPEGSLPGVLHLRASARLGCDSTSGREQRPADRQHDAKREEESDD